MIEIRSKENCLSHYKWGDNCDGWNFVASQNSAVKQEFMPASTFEKLHFHKVAEQFFYILSGTASFIIGDETIEVSAKKGIHIKAGAKHKIMNNTMQGLEFLLFSNPPTQNDRTDCE